MANFLLRTLLAHLLTFLDGLQRSFWNPPQPLLSAIFLLLLEAGPKPSPIAHVPRVHDLPNYTNSVDLSTMCLLPTIFQTPPMNLICSVDHPDYAQDDAFPVEPELPHFYASLDSIPVQRNLDESSPLPQPEQVETDHAQTNMDLYGARGLSFCPVLVGIMYLHSLLHLYMLLMIPSLVNHWFEDVSLYESLNPTGLSDCSRLLHTSLLVAPWYLVRYGLRKLPPCLYRRLRRVTHKPARSSIPRIVLIRVDGAAVPVHFVEAHQAKAGVGERQAFKSEDLETRNDRDEVSDGGDSKDVVQSDISDGDDFIASEFEALPMSTVSQQGQSQGGTANSHGRVGPGPLIPDVANDSHDQHFVNASGIPDELWEKFPGPVRAGNEPLQHVEELDDFGQIAFPGVADDDPRDNTNYLGEQENSNQHVDSNPRNLIDDYESETASAALSATSSSVESQDTLTPAKNVRFAVDDDADATGGRQAISSATHIEEYTGAWNLGSLFGDDDDIPFEAPMDAKSPTQVTERILQEGSDEQGNDLMFAEPLSPFLTGEPVVNLPALVIARGDTRVVDMDPMVHAVLVEDIATRSPLQILAPNVPAVVINANYAIEADEEQSLTMDSGELALDQEAILNEAEVGATSDIASPREDGSWPASPSVEGPHPICSPIIDRKPPVDDVRLMETALPASASISEAGFPLTCAGLVVTDASPSDTRGVSRINKIEGEVIYGLGGLSGGKDLPRSPRNDLPGPGTSRVNTNAEIYATTADSLVGPGAEHVISGQYLDFSRAVVTEPLTMQPSERAGASPDICEDDILLSTRSVEKNSDELRDRKSREGDITLWDLPTTISQPCPQRTLSGSMHAPLGSDPLSILQTNSYIDQASVLCGSFPLMRFEDGKGSTVTENASERAQDLFASIHAPKKVSKPEGLSLDSDSRNGSGRDHCRSVTNPVAVSKDEPSTKPGSPNWAAMPEVVDAFRMFKQPHSGNGLRRASSISECTSRGPMAGIVGQKGLATNSLNNTSTIANIRGRWMRGGGLLLVRDLVPSDPADFNLRTCAMVAGSTEIQQQQSVLVPPEAETVQVFGSPHLMAYQG